MRHQSLRMRIAIALMLFSATCSAGLTFGDDAQTPSLTLAPAEVALDVPMPAQGNDLARLLAQSGSGNSLSKLKEESERKFSLQLQSEVYNQLRKYFADEEVPLVHSDGYLTLRSFFDISASKQLNELKNSGDVEIERGTLELSGDFHYQLLDSRGRALRERRIDIADLRVHEKYRIKTPHDGSNGEDTTEVAMAEALSEMVERLLDRIEDDLEADELRELATL